MFKARINSFYETFISLKGTPQSIALGLAIGIFVGVTPTIPFHTAIIVTLTLLFRQNLTAAYLGSWMISNPLTIPIFYVSQYELGRFILGMAHCRIQWDDYSFGAITKMSTDILIPLLTGGFLMAPIFSITAFFLSRRLITSIRAKRDL